MRWRYLSGSLSPPFFSKAPGLAGLSEAPAGPWPSVKSSLTPVAPLGPLGVSGCVSGQLCFALASVLLSDDCSLLCWLLSELLPILEKQANFVNFFLKATKFRVLLCSVRTCKNLNVMKDSNQTF